MVDWREIATGEHKYMETEIKMRGKGDLQLRYDLAKLWDKIPVAMESSERRVGAAGVWVSVATTRGKRSWYRGFYR